MLPVYTPSRRFNGTGDPVMNLPWTHAGLPALGVPAGHNAEGLPMGLQIIGRPFDEATVLRVADAYQRLTDWHTRRPEMAA
jgi:aspartyl-tRNA(Asn)/glutamyl-tRNA(Gln) amidotransferase subunit A